MLQRLIDGVVYFIDNLNQNISVLNPADRFGLIISICTLIVAIIASFTALGIYRTQLKISNIKRIISIISSFDLLYFSLEKHYKSWKESKGESSSEEAREFWKIISLTELATSMQELKTLSTVYSKRLINVEINALMDFLEDMILISYGGVDRSEKDYIQENIISSDEFEIQMSALVKKLSRVIGIKVHKTPPKDILKNYIASHFLK